VQHWQWMHGRSRNERTALRWGALPREPQGSAAGVATYLGAELVEPCERQLGCGRHGPQRRERVKRKRELVTDRLEFGTQLQTKHAWHALCEGLVRPEAGRPYCRRLPWPV
jgi:hypothetical protein